jgi:hypothetical protein
MILIVPIDNIFQILHKKQQQPQQSSELQDNGEKLENQPQKPSKRNRGRRTYSTPVVPTTTIKEN